MASFLPGFSFLLKTTGRTQHASSVNAACNVRRVSSESAQGDLSGLSGAVHHSGSPCFSCWVEEARRLRVRLGSMGSRKEAA